jgi:hypothetical protein
LLSADERPSLQMRETDPEEHQAILVELQARAVLKDL